MMHTPRTLLALLLWRELRLQRIAEAAERHQHRAPFRAMTCPTCNPEE